MIWDKENTNKISYNSSSKNYKIFTIQIARMKATYKLKASKRQVFNSCLVM